MLADASEDDVDCALLDYAAARGVAQQTLAHGQASVLFAETALQF